jgi:hypothetical protein
VGRQYHARPRWELERHLRRRRLIEDATAGIAIGVLMVIFFVCAAVYVGGAVR